MTAAAILKNHKKSRYLLNGFTDLYEIWYADAKWASYQLRPLKIEFQKCKLPDSCHSKNRYITISLQAFDRFLLNLARWCTLVPSA